MSSLKSIVVCGPTASGKSDFAMELARRFNGEIICADSVQVYSGFVVGSAAPSSDDKNEIPHHLFGIIEPNLEYDAAQFRMDARQAIVDIQKRGKLPILCGGTGLYLRALMGLDWDESLPHDEKIRDQVKSLEDRDLHEELKSIDPVRYGQIHPNDRFRLERALEICRITGKPVSEIYKEKGEAQGAECKDHFLIIKVNPDRAILHRRIEHRSQKMLASGLQGEVKRLLEVIAKPEESKPLQSIGYKQMVSYLNGDVTSQDLLNKIIFATRQYAKRQSTFFKKFPSDIEVVSSDEMPAVMEEVSSLIGIPTIDMR